MLSTIARLCVLQFFILLSIIFVILLTAGVVAVLSKDEVSTTNLFIAFRVSREMYSGHASVCVSVRCCIPTLLYCTDPDVTWGNGRGCPLVVHYWADLQSLHGFRCYDNIARTRDVSQCLYSLCPWLNTLVIYISQTSVDDVMISVTVARTS